MPSRTQSAGGGGKIQVEPNPVSEGGTITISGPAGATVYVAVDGGREKPLEVKLDGKGRKKLRAPGKGGQTLTVFTGTVPPEFVVVEVIAQGR